MNAMIESDLVIWPMIESDLVIWPTIESDIDWI